MIHRLDRYEWKFLISREQRETLMPRLMPHLCADTNAGAGASYPIVSLYYDSAERDCYWEKVRGLRSRRKLRIRVYGSACGTVEPTCFVEVKQKCDARVAKRRAQMPIAAALALCAGETPARALGFAERKLVDEVHGFVRARDFRPSCCMRYDRHAFADRDPASDVRITFDIGIAYRMENLTPSPDDRQFDRVLLQDGQAVMEVKATGAVPYWLARLLAESGCVLQSHSKYCNALEAGDAVLRAMLSRGGKQTLPVATARAEIGVNAAVSKLCDHPAMPIIA